MVCFVFSKCSMVSSVVLSGCLANHSMVSLYAFLAAMHSLSQIFLMVMRVSAPLLTLMILFILSFPFFCFPGCVVYFYARLDIVYEYVEVQSAVVFDAFGFHLDAVCDQVVSFE